MELIVVGIYNNVNYTNAKMTIDMSITIKPFKGSLFNLMSYKVIRFT